jgi:AcrR family transcriptional regulator
MVSFRQQRTPLVHRLAIVLLGAAENKSVSRAVVLGLAIPPCIHVCFRHVPTAKRRVRQPHQLPPGRHGLPRGFVVSNQRERILDAVADVTSLAGYGEMSVEDIVVTAGVSRRTFYDNFKDKQDAFLAAYDAVTEQLIASVQRAYAQSSTFAGGVRDCLAVFLEFVASEPRFADMCIVEALAAGPEAVERRNTVMGAFAAMIRTGADAIEGHPRPPQLTAETIVGGIYEVVYSRVLGGQTAELPALLGDLAYSMMLPFIGHEDAQREAAKPPSAATLA